MVVEISHKNETCWCKIISSFLFNQFFNLKFQATTLLAKITPDPFNAIVIQDIRLSFLKMEISFNVKI